MFSGSLYASASQGYSGLRKLVRTAGHPLPARTAALAAADVGIAMGTGTDVAMSSAQLTLVKGDLRRIVQARAISSLTVANMKQNLGFAFVYNAIGVPIAAAARA